VEKAFVNASRCSQIPIVRHIGYLSPSRDVTTFLQALEVWDKAIDTERIDVEFIGNIRGQASRIERFMRASLRKVRVRIEREVGFDESIALIRDATVCVLIESTGSEGVFLPSKFCNYAFEGKPILAIGTPSSTVGDYLQSYGGGIAVSHGDVSGAYRALKSLVGGMVCGSSVLAGKFEPQAIVRSWDTVFQALHLPRSPRSLRRGVEE
jgi:hypothetical protein